VAPEASVVSLVRAAQRGDILAMANLLDHLTPIVGRICGPIALADGPDAAQESLIIVMRSLRTLRDPSALYGWVRMIAVRESIRTAKRARRDRLRSIDTLAAVPAREDTELRVNLRAVLDRLSPEHRAVLVLRDLEGFEEPDAAAMLRVPTGTVKSRLHRARAHFQKEWIP
jgi:RNA polymerase sigma-70 factor (ECF subfamily)